MLQGRRRFSTRCERWHCGVARSGGGSPAPGAVASCSCVCPPARPRLRGTPLCLGHHPARSPLPRAIDHQQHNAKHAQRQAADQDHDVGEFHALHGAGWGPGRASSGWGRFGPTDFAATQSSWCTPDQTPRTCSGVTWPSSINMLSTRLMSPRALVQLPLKSQRLVQLRLGDEVCGTAVCPAACPGDQRGLRPDQRTARPVKAGCAQEWRKASRGLLTWRLARRQMPDRPDLV